MPSNRCLDPDEVLSPGQTNELDRVINAYPSLVDREFVREHLERWLE
jgi:predicted AlkP superfamily phosphohydrolase/phosphomutase